MKVKYIDKTDPYALLNKKVYEVLSISKCSGRYRIIDETDEDYLYPKEMFEIVEKYPIPPFET